MSDVVRDIVREMILDCDCPWVPGYREKVVAALDAEREAHETLKMKHALMEKFAEQCVKNRLVDTEAYEKEVADLKDKLRESEHQVDNQASMLETFSRDNLDLQATVDDLRKRIEELTAQLQDEVPT